jgi:hypothetical protein
MTTLTILTIGFWIVAALATTWFLETFRRHVVRSTTSAAPRGFADGAWPEALVILSLRGGDASLTKTLDGLANQNYPRYRIRIVVDHPSDEADDVVRRWRLRNPAAPVDVEYLREPLDRCTLKCSAIHQVLRSVPAEIGAVVIVDGDSDPYPLWLRDAMAPLADPQNGAATGNRWYFPRRGGVAGWCRFIFTALSLPTMWLHRFSWGGTLAIRRDIACSDEFLAALTQNPTEENTCYKLLPTLGKQMYMSSQLIQWNPESTGFGGAERHLFRQSLWGRLFYPCWGSILFGTAMIVVAAIASFVGAVQALLNSRFVEGLPLALGLTFAALAVNSLIGLHRTLCTHVFARQGRSLPRVTWRLAGEQFIALLCMLVVYSCALLRAHFAKEIRWRGIAYRISADGAIRMTGYVPFRPVSPVFVGDAPAIPRPAAQAAAPQDAEVLPQS